MKFLYGADYNPEQWKNHPEILKKDIELLCQSEYSDGARWKRQRANMIFRFMIIL